MVRRKKTRKAGPISKEYKVGVVNDIVKMIESGDIWKYNNYQLAERFNITNVSITKFIDEAYTRVDQVDVNQVKINLKEMYERLFGTAQQMVLDAVTTRDKKDAITTLLKVASEFNTFMENFGIKEKVAENINIVSEKQLLIVNEEKPAIEIQAEEIN